MSREARAAASRSGDGNESGSAKPSPGRRAQKPAPAKTLSRVSTLLFAFAVIAVLIYGYLRSDENWITAEEGLGYILGIVGSLFMLILLSYALRKRFRPMRGMGRMPGWLKFHMILGILGPVMVVFHANFKLGATNNAAVAMIAMLVVVASGIVGRFFYGKTHNRLSGELNSLQDLRAETQAARLEFELDFTKLPELRETLDRIETRILDPGQSALSSTWHYFEFAFSKGGHRRRLNDILKAAIADDVERRGLQADVRAQLDSSKRYVSEYLRRLQRAAGFRFYERMFALWHVLHVPLLFLLIAATVIHIAAVHLY